ncbi:hypothetical protein ACOMHN_002598 [Nucella lapillus]
MRPCRNEACGGAMHGEGGSARRLADFFRGHVSTTDMGCCKVTTHGYSLVWRQTFVNVTDCKEAENA